MNADQFNESWTPEPFSGCWLWFRAIGRDGYGNVRWNGKLNPAHRISWQINRGAIPPKSCVLHHCDTRTCVNPDHLFLGTHADNNHDRHAKGRTATGETHGRAKLTSEQVNRIRTDSRKLREIAPEYGVSLALISLIKNNKQWRQ